MRNYKRPDTPVLLSINELFARDLQLRIPTWQREYSWDADEEVRLLLEDLDKFCSSNEFNYVLGSIITFPNADGSHSVVDGQQRTITLYSLILSIRDVLEKRFNSEFGDKGAAPEGYKALFQMIDGLVRKISIDAKAEISLPIFMEYGEGNQVLTALAIKSPIPSGILTTSHAKLVAAFEKCKDFLDEKYPNSKVLAEFARAVVNGTFLVETNVGDQRQALDIFFKMNARGRDLESSDYLKNYMFQQLSNDKYDEVSERWATMSKALRSTETTRIKLKTPEFFLRNWAIVDRGEKISGDQGVWEYWHKKFESDPGHLETFLEEIVGQATVFNRITSNKLVFTGHDNLLMVGADYFKGTQYLPVLLAGASLDAYEYLSSLVNFRYLIYILSQERTQDFESLVPRWAKVVSLLDKKSSILEIDESLKAVPGLCLDKNSKETLLSKLKDLTLPKDEKKIRLVLGMSAVKLHDTYADLSEYLKKYSISKKYGFDLDPIFSFEKIRDLNLDPYESIFRTYTSIGNVALVNGQGKHFLNKTPAAKEGLYAADKSPLTQSLSSNPEKHDSNSYKVVMEFRNSCPVELTSFDLDQIEMRRDAIARLFIDSIPSALIIG